MLAPVRVIAPAVLPVSLDEAKAHLRIDYDDDDALIEGLIGAAVDHLDGWTGVLGRCLVEQTWQQDFEAACQILPLPLAPVISIVAVTYTNANGDTAAVDRADYALKTDAGGRSAVMVRAGAVPHGPISVTYVAGYATSPEVPADGEAAAVPAKTMVPAALKTAILIMVGHWHANREAVSVGESVNKMPFAVDALLQPYRVYR